MSGDQECPESIRNNQDLCNTWKGGSSGNGIMPWGQDDGQGGFVPAPGSPLDECGWRDDLGASQKERAKECLKKIYDETIKKTLDTANKFSIYKKREMGSSMESVCFAKNDNKRKKILDEEITKLQSIISSYYWDAKGIEDVHQNQSTMIQKKESIINQLEEKLHFP